MKATIIRMMQTVRRDIQQDNQSKAALETEIIKRLIETDGCISSETLLTINQVASEVLS